jgi:hypothetical protein
MTVLTDNTDVSKSVLGRQCLLPASSDVLFNNEEGGNILFRNVGEHGVTSQEMVPFGVDINKNERGSGYSNITTLG